MIKTQNIVKPLKDFTEFLKVKKLYPFNDYRQKSKPVNFGLLFGMSASSLVRTVLSKYWTHSDVLSFIKENQLEEQVISLRVKKKDLTEEGAQLLQCAIFIRNLFFKAYPRLLERIEAHKKLAGENGYIRSYHGAIRRLPELAWPRGEDDDMKIISNLENISTNTDIQNFETVIMHRSMVLLTGWLEKNSSIAWLKRHEVPEGTPIIARIFVIIHDAVELYIHKEFIGLVTAKVKEIMELAYEEYKGIPIECEGNVADYWVKNQLWDMGEPMSQFEDDSLKEFENGRD